MTKRGDLLSFVQEKINPPELHLPVLSSAFGSIQIIYSVPAAIKGKIPVEDEQVSSLKEPSLAVTMIARKCYHCFVS